MFFWLKKIRLFEFFSNFFKIVSMFVRQQFEWISLLIKHKKKSWKIILIWFYMFFKWLKKSNYLILKFFWKLMWKLLMKVLIRSKLILMTFIFQLKIRILWNDQSNFFERSKKNENITFINALHFWSKLMHIFLLWLIENNFSILLFLISLYVKKIFLWTAFSKNSI